MVSSRQSGAPRAFGRSKSRRLWAAALCAGSFLAGQLVFGEDAASQPSLLSQYLQSKSRTAAELAADSGAAGVAPAAADKNPPASLKPAAVQVAEAPLVAARPLPVIPAIALGPPQDQSQVVPASNTSAEERLAPIVPAWAMPKRPGARGQGSGGRGQESVLPTPAPPIQNPYVGPPQPLRIEIGQGGVKTAVATQPLSPQTVREEPKVNELPAAPPQAIPPLQRSSPPPTVVEAPPVAFAVAQSQPQGADAPRSPADAGHRREAVVGSPADAGVRPAVVAGSTAQATAPLEIAPNRTPTIKHIPPPQLPNASESRSGVRTAEFEAKLIQQRAQSAPLAVQEEFGVLPEGSPFEAIPQSGSLKLRVRRSMLLRTKVDIYRTAIVDPSVCDIVQFTPREVSIIGRSVGQTHVTFWFDDPAMAPLTYLVEVRPDVEQVKADEDKYQLLQDVINEMFPDSKIHLVIVADKLLVKGQAKDSEEAAQIMTIVRAQASGARGGIGLGGLGGYGGVADALATPVLSQAATGGNQGPSYQIINMLRVPGVQQVALKVKIAELNRTAARGFGVDVSGTIDLSDSVNGSKLFLASLLNASATGGTSLIAQVDGDDINIGFRYLQERGVIRLLSEPTLVTLSGRPATFIAGGEFAVPTIVGSVGLNAVTTDFRSFGAIISFLPTIVDKDRIRLQVAPEFSQLNRQLAVGGTPGLNVRAATTTVEMREGQTLAIAGLLEDSYKATNVGDLPGLAKLFGRRDTARSETELIILVTPELVHPMEPEEVPPLPGFDVTEPNACQFFFCGEIEGNPTQDYRSTVWPRLRKRYGMGGPAMTSGPFGHGQ